MNDYLRSQTKNLPENVRAYLTSVKAADLDVLIREKYDFTLPQFRAYLDVVASVYVKDMAAVDLLNEIKRIFGFTDNVARQLACDLAGVRLLVVADWLETDVAGLIKSWGGDPAKYQSHVAAQQKAIVEEAKYFQEQWAEPMVTEDEPATETETEIDWQARAERLKTMFARDLVNVLRLADEDMVIEINDSLLYLLGGEQETLQEDLSNAMLANNEVLTGERLVLDGKQVDPTIGNWLAYFFRQKGSAMFDALNLSDFMTNDPAVRNLDAIDKQLLNDLLLTYRNLKFFPDSLIGYQPDDWFIIPVPEDGESEANDAVETPPPIASPVKSQLIDINQEPIAALRAMAERYPAGSLERAALEEEIMSLQK